MSFLLALGRSDGAHGVGRRHRLMSPIDESRRTWPPEESPGPLRLTRSDAAGQGVPGAVTVASRVTVPAWRKVRISGTLGAVSNGAGSCSTTSSPNGLRVRVPCAGMARSLTTILGPAGPSRAVRTTWRAIGLGGDELVGGVAEVADGKERGRGADRGRGPGGEGAHRDGGQADLEPDPGQGACTAGRDPGGQQREQRHGADHRAERRPRQVAQHVSPGFGLCGPGRRRRGGTGRPREDARRGWPGRDRPAEGLVGVNAGRGTASGAGCCRRRSASWPTWRSRRTAG